MRTKKRSAKNDVLRFQKTNFFRGCAKVDDDGLFNSSILKLFRLSDHGKNYKRVTFAIALREFKEVSSKFVKMYATTTTF